MGLIKTIAICLIVLATCSCQKKEQQDPQKVEKLAQLGDLYPTILEWALELRDQYNGWLTPEDCDGIIWSGKYGASVAVENVYIEEAEFADEPGRFGRRPVTLDNEPQERCWSEQTGDVGAATTWSRDMFVAGLLPWAWVNKELEVLERHASYGKKKNWKMGEPLDDGRVLYTPGMIGLLYEAIYSLGGEDSANRLWPTVWPKGLDDYEAHLQTMAIWLTGELAADLEDADAVPRKQSELSLSISGTMYKRLEEHKDREPQNPWYQYLYHLYEDGDFEPAVDLLLDEDMPMGSYVRCKPEEPCKLADWLFTASEILKRYSNADTGYF